MKNTLITVFSVCSLCACNGAPTDDDVKLALQRKLDQEQAQLAFFTGRHSDKYMSERINEVIATDVLGCAKDGPGQICDYKIKIRTALKGESYEQIGHGRKRFVLVDGQWLIDDSAQM